MFEIHKTTLQLMKTKKNYDKLRGIVQKKLIDADIRRALTVLDSYWTNYPDHALVLPDVFMAELTLQNPDLDEADIKMYKGMSDIMQQEPDEASATGLIRSLRTLDFAAKLESAHELYHQGLDMDLHSTVRELLGTFERDISRDLSVEYCQDTLAEIIADIECGHRLPWFLNCLNGSMPDVRTGMQIIFAARPGKGKTSFCAKQIVSLAGQTPDDRPVLWFNNEGKANRIKGTI